MKIFVVSPKNFGEKTFGQILSSNKWIFTWTKGNQANLQYETSAREGKVTDWINKSSKKLTQTQDQHAKFCFFIIFKPLIDRISICIYGFGKSSRSVRYTLTFRVRNTWICGSAIYRTRESCFGETLT